MQIITLDPWSELGIIRLRLDDIKMSGEENLVFPRNAREGRVHGWIFAVKETIFQSRIAKVIIDQRSSTVDFIKAFIRRGGDRRYPNQLLSQIQNFRGLIRIGDFDHSLRART